MLPGAHHRRRPDLDNPIEVERHRRWFAVARPRDALVAATDTHKRQWYVVDDNDQRRGRLNGSAQLLNQIPYHMVRHVMAALSARDKPRRSIEPPYPCRRVPQEV